MARRRVTGESRRLMPMSERNVDAMTGVIRRAMDDPYFKQEFARDTSVAASFLVGYLHDYWASDAGSRARREDF